MSKSMKHNPIYRDPVDKTAKRAANRRVRRNGAELPNGGAYKKLFQSYDISDFRTRKPLCEGADAQEWAKYFKRK